MPQRTGQGAGELTGCKLSEGLWGGWGAQQGVGVAGAWEELPPPRSSPGPSHAQPHRNRPEDASSSRDKSPSPSH